MIRFDKKSIFVLALALILGIISSTLCLYDVASWDSGTVTGECYEWTENSLTPLGYASYPHILHGFRHSDVYEGFEWGEDGDWLEPSGGHYQWNIGDTGETGTSLSEISETMSIDGYRSARLYYDGVNIARALEGTDPNDDYTMSFWWYKEADCQLALYWGDGTHCIYITHSSIENFSYYDGSWHIIATPSANTWHNLVLDDLDYSNGTYDIWVDGVLLANDATMRDWNGSNKYVSLYCQVGVGSVYIDQYNCCWLTETATGSYGEGGFSLDIDGLQQNTVYYLQAYAMSMWGLFQISDVFACSTSGQAPFPIWLVIILVVIVALGIYTKSLILSIAGVVLCIVSYSWLIHGSPEDVGTTGGAAFFLILIAWIILNLIYREHRSG